VHNDWFVADERKCYLDDTLGKTEKPLWLIAGVVDGLACIKAPPATESRDQRLEVSRLP
jgi:hypothetical protein